eukprot:s362_g6.t1
MASGLKEELRQEEQWHQLVIEALAKHAAWPSLLAHAVKKSGQARDGLLFCAADARGDAVQLQIPVATQPRIAPLCAMARRSDNAKHCEKSLKHHLPGHTGLAFQFFPGTLWKTVVEPQLHMKVNRANLKADNILLLVVWLMLPPKQTHRFRNDVFLELAFYEEGSQLPRALASKLTPEIKVELGCRLGEAQNTDNHLASILRVVGLDHEFLHAVPAYQQFYALCSSHLQTLFSPTDLLTPVWLNEQGAATRLDQQGNRKILDSLMAFFAEHRHVIHSLQDIMGHDRVAAALQNLEAEHIQLAQQMAQYSHGFTGQLLKPCVASGLPTAGPYPCPCKCPVFAPPAPFGDEKAVQPSGGKTQVVVQASFAAFLLVIALAFKRAFLCDSFFAMANKDAEEAAAEQGVLQPKLGDRIMVLRQPWLNAILDGTKTMEVRCRKHRAGRVWLGSGGVIHGRVRIMDSVQLSEEDFRARAAEHLWPADAEVPYENPWGLLLAEVEKMNPPLPYWRSPSAIGWNIYRASKDDLPMKTFNAKGTPKRKTDKKRARSESPAAASGAAADTRLWQIQLAGGNQKAFAFNILAIANEVLRDHPDLRVRSLKDLEEVQQLRLVIGSPAKSGDSDPDGVGIKDWQLAIYSGKGGVSAALNFIHFVLQQKISKGYWSSMPTLQARVMDPATCALPEPWQTLSDATVAMPLPFGALPPKGRRHVVCQLDRQGESIDDGYTVTFFGGIYHYKDRFENHHIQGTLLPVGTSNKRDYVRYLECSMDAAAKQRIAGVLDAVLLGVPLYFINAAGGDDPMAAWLQLQPSIIQVELYQDADAPAVAATAIDAVSVDDD